LSKAKKLAAAILRDREQRNAIRRPAKVKPRVEVWDPLKECPAGPWRVVAKGDHGSGYLPRTPMRMGSVGWFIQCVACGTEFESIGLAHCGKPECRMAALRRKSTTEGYVPPPPRPGARLCECGCGRPIPKWRKGRAVSKATRFFSDKCAAKGRRKAEMARDTGAAVLSPETLKKCLKNKDSESALFPTDLIGSGDLRPQTRALDPELRKAILESESRPLPGKTPQFGDAIPSDWRPTGTGADMPDLPAFLRRRP
jgi:hypothetical protein